ncbi:MAG TPA: hypothetical protein VJ600_01030 [Holophagaceae bacterium]|nr:hypothetical protein [Holophagaceae bacterium]
MRRVLPLLSCAALAAPLPAQAPSGIYGQEPDAWPQLMARLKAWPSPVVQTFACFYPKSMLGPWLSQDAFVRLRVSGELGFFELDEAGMKAVRAHLGTGPEPRWILVSPKEEILGNGTDAPTPDKFRSLMEATGWRSRWDQRADFLQAHPGSGDAWSDELREQARFVGRQAMLGLQIQAEQKTGDPDRVDLGSFDQDQVPTDPTQDEARWGPMARALHGLMEVDGWTEWGGLGSAALGLRIGGARGSGVLKPEFERLRQEVESALRRSPSSDSLWLAWSTASALGEVGDPQALLASMEPAPGQPWPPLAASDALGDALTAREDWAGLEHLAAQAMARALTPEVMAGQDARDFLIEVLGAWAPLRMRALMRLDRIEDASGLVSEARSLAGRRWPFLSRALRAEAIAVLADYRDPQAKPEGKGAGPALPPALAELLDRSPVPDPPKPTLPPPLNLALVGQPDWAKAFQSLRTSAALDPWEPAEELGWTALDARRATALRARMGWGSEPRWVLLRGEELLESGTTLPEPRALADRLRAHGLPHLEQLDAFLRRHPDHEEARLARLEMLAARMPNQRLEARLLEDARTTLAPFPSNDLVALLGSGAWKPVKELWEPAALKVLPALEARLQSWPEDAEAWLAFVDWSALGPRRESPAALLATLPVWKTRARGGAGPLPDEVGMAVALRLQALGRWEPLAAWGRTFWEGGLRAQAKADARSGRRPGAVLARWGDLEKRLVLPYRQALQELDRVAELRALEEDLREIKGSLPSLPPRGRAKS